MAPGSIIEPVHFVYNAAFLLLLAAVYYLGGFLSRDARLRPLVFWLMTFVLIYQAYHFTEHIFKLAQFVETMMNGTPGILGHFFNLVWLHFTYNTVEYIPVVLVFFLGNFHRSAIAAVADATHLRMPRRAGA